MSSPDGQPETDTPRRRWRQRASPAALSAAFGVWALLVVLVGLAVWALIAWALDGVLGAWPAAGLVWALGAVPMLIWALRSDRGATVDADESWSRPWGWPGS